MTNKFSSVRSLHRRKYRKKPSSHGHKKPGQQCCLELDDIVERLFKAFHNSPVIMSITDATTARYIDVNDMWIKTTGYARKEAIGSTTQAMNLWAEPREHEAYLRELQKQGKVNNFKGHIRSKNGEIRSMLASLQPVTINARPCYLITMTDITEHEQIEEKMAILDRLNMVGEMAASIGHELRNPMTAVRGFLQLFSIKEKYSEDRELLQLMIEELDRANQIISEFLSLAKNKAVTLKAKNLNTIISSLFPIIRAEAAAQDKNINVHLGALPMVLLDCNEIQQLIFNLVKNGFEAMPSGRTLTISTYADEQSVILSVQDQGYGIKKELMEKISTPFFTTKDNGAGLGLAVCYSIAARHQASIDIKSDSNGTTVSVYFKAAFLKGDEG